MERIFVFDLGSTRLKTLEFVDGAAGEYRVFKVVGGDGILDPSLFREVAEDVRNKYDLYIITGQRASIIGWDSSGASSNIYTWRSEVDIEYRRKYLDPEDYMLNLFIRPGSGALRIKYLQERGHRYVGGIESYLAWLLTGEYIVDYSYAYPYGLLDPIEPRYIDYLIERLELDIDRLPRLVDSYRECVEEGVPILMIPDQSASLVSEGLEVSKATLGTGAFIDVYTGGELIGDPDKGVNPMLSFYIDGTPHYMAEGFIFDWGVSLDKYLERFGFGYESISKVDIGESSYKVYPPLLRSTLSPKAIDVESEGYSLRDVVLSLVGSVGMYIEVLREIRDFKEVYLDGGGVGNPLIPRLIAESADVDVVVRDGNDRTSLYGAYLYLIMRRGGDWKSFIDVYRPVKYRYESSDRYSWVIEVYREAVEKLN